MSRQIGADDGVRRSCYDRCGVTPVAHVVYASMPRIYQILKRSAKRGILDVRLVGHPHDRRGAFDRA